MFKKSLNLFFTVFLFVAPSISFAAEGMTLSYSKTISALDSYTKLLIHGDSTSDSTGKTVTANGDAAVTTAQYKFSELGRSIAFDGSGDYLTIPYSSDWDFQGDLTTAWTIDFWLYPTDFSAEHGYFGQYGTDTSQGFAAYSTASTAGETRTNLSVFGYWGNSPYNCLQVNGTITKNVWQHIAIVKTNDTARMFVNGIQTAEATFTKTQTWTNTFDIGRCRVAGGQVLYLQGYIDEFRVSRGIARWTSDFTPPTSPYDGARTIVNITGLDGDTDEEYRIICRMVNGYNGAANIGIRPNNDSNNNYGYQYLQGADTAPAAGRVTTFSYIQICGASSLSDISQGECFLYAKSGYIRSAITNLSHSVSGTTVTAIVNSGQSWNNTADNITSLVVFASQTNGLGVGTNIELYKKSAR